MHGLSLTGHLTQVTLFKEEVQMRLNRISFMAGFAAGFVAGARSGRETYDQIVKYARDAYEHPTVQQARGNVQTQATGLAQKVGGQLGDILPQMAQNAAQSVGAKIPGMRQKSDNGVKPASQTSAYASSSSGTSQQPGPDLTR